MPLHFPHTAAVRIQRAWRTGRPSPLITLRPVEIRGGRRRRGRRVPRAPREAAPTRVLPFPDRNAPPGRLHGWYSRKQSDRFYRIPSSGDPCSAYYELYLGGGEMVEVTEVTSVPVPWSTCDDVEYRGLVTNYKGVCRPGRSGLLHRLGMI